MFDSKSKSVLDHIIKGMREEEGKEGLYLTPFGFGEDAMPE